MFLSWVKVYKNLLTGYPNLGIQNFASNGCHMIIVRKRGSPKQGKDIKYPAWWREVSVSKTSVMDSPLNSGHSWSLTASCSRNVKQLLRRYLLLPPR